MKSKPRGKSLNGLPVRRMKIAELTKAPYNPRTISEQQAAALKHSIETFGLVEPIIVNERTGNIVGGHQRLDALAASGVAATDVVIVDLEPEREKALNLALNKISGEWDDDSLKDLLRQFETDDLPLTGFDEKELDRLLSGAGGSSVHTTQSETKYFVMIECDDEAHCQTTYERFLNEGMKVKIVT